jgi:hypothetical protein
MDDAGSLIDLFDRATAQMLESPRRRGSAVRLPGEGHLLATGDLHDNPIHLAKILRVARLDESADRHVVLHELIHGERLINGLDFSYRILARVAALVLEYPEQVHPMLGNHELAQLTGRGVSKGGGDSVVLFEGALDYAFSEDAPDVAAAIDRFFTALPLAVVSDSGVLCAHSLPSAHRIDRFDVGILDRGLHPEDFEGPGGSAYLMVWGRGYDEATVERLASAWNVQLFCLGHEHVETGIEIRGRRVVILNSDHERGTVLPIDLADPPAPETAVYSGVPLSSVPEP